MTMSMCEPRLTSPKCSLWLPVMHTVSLWCCHPPACKGWEHSASRANSSARNASSTLTPGPSFATPTPSARPSNSSTTQIHTSTLDTRLDTSPLGVSHCSCCHCCTPPPPHARHYIVRVQNKKQLTCTPQLEGPDHQVQLRGVLRLNTAGAGGSPPPRPESPLGSSHRVGHRRQHPRSKSVNSTCSTHKTYVLCLMYSFFSFSFSFFSFSVNVVRKLHR